ncbi:hypothetical protein ARMSODRAFT_988569 [Armillaria solidipes]|uniref:Uncharacterized protein n=1 Tax=Armillaria solidipes TaxID=1076256 RepID=A0A2H3BRL3_9AGAR|nr:hypothetical protein ARMSODRAFT_988569 [Armillaria solidipes]
MQTFCDDDEGRVTVRDGVIIAKARNRTNELRNASRHVELEVIDQILAEPPELSQCGSVLGTNNIYHPVHSVYKAAGGYHREEAIVILHWFHIMENTNAPVPKLKVNHVLKTEILPE